MKPRITIVDKTLILYADENRRIACLCKLNQGQLIGGNQWKIPITQILAFYQSVQRQNLDIELDPAVETLINRVIRIKSEQARESEQFNSELRLDDPLPNGWFLRHYQKKGVEWLLNNPKSILADDMGLGKTVTSLVAAQKLSAFFGFKVIVVAPVSLIDNWKREALEIVGIDIDVYSWSKIPDSIDENFILIVDEAHYAQSLKSQRTKKLLKLACLQTNKRTWLLTGTPMKNGRPINLFPLLKICGHYLADDKHYFERHFCNGHYRRYGNRKVWDTSGSKNLTELNSKISSILLRRTKKECLKELPPKSHLLTEISLSGKVLTQYNTEIKNAVDEYRERVYRGEVSEIAEAVVTVGNVRRISSVFKAKESIPRLEEFIEQDNPVVVFTEFVESAELIASHFSTLAFTGKLSQPERAEVIRGFKSGESKVFVGTIKAGGVGLTLTESSDVVIVDLPWTPGDLAQAEDRCYRLGQSNPVMVWHSILAHSPVDAAIYKLIHQKQRNIEIVLGQSTVTLSGRSQSELSKQLVKII